MSDETKKETKITWETRDEVKTEQEAIQALSDLISSSWFIRSSGYFNAKETEYSKKSIEQAKEILQKADEYAQKWSVPFSKEFTVSMIQQMSNKRWNGDEPYLEREDYDSDEEYQDAVEAREDDYGISNTHVWTSSSETSMC